MLARPTGGQRSQLPSSLAPDSLLGLLLAGAAGALAAVVVLPAWLPALSASLLGPSPRAYWYLSRGSGLVAFGLLWLCMVFGLLATSRVARMWPGGPVAFDLHQHTGLLGLAFGLLHALVLLGDRTVPAGLPELLVPFAYAGYRPFWVGVGQIAFALMLAIVLSSYARRSIGARAWRVIHFASFVAFVGALAHGLASGTDASAAWARGLYWASGGSVLFLAVYRVLVTRRPEPRSGEAAAPRS